MSQSTVAAVLRSDQAYYAQLSRTETLNNGIAFYSEAFPSLHEANQLREIVLAGRSAADLYRQVEDFYGGRGLTCFRWVPAVDQPADAIEAELGRHGWSARRRACLRLRELVDFGEQRGIRVLPARAMRRAYRETFTSEGGAARDVVADAADERLNDPRMDAYVAVWEGRAVGRGALFTIGEIGHVRSFRVLPPGKGVGAADALMHQIAAVCRRLTIPIVCYDVDAADDGAIRLFERSGFERDGEIVEFVPQTVIDAPQRT